MRGERAGDAPRRAVARIGLLIAAVAIGCGEEPEVDVEPEAAEAPLAEPSAPEAASAVEELPESYVELRSMLESDEVLMEWKHEIVLDELAPDPSPHATTVLLLGTRNESLPISMASLTALGGRSDPRIEPHLVELLGDPAWQRRAWAARLLGQPRHAAARGALVERLEVETDPRVRRQLEDAIASLSGVAAGPDHDPDAVEGTGG